MSTDHEMVCQQKYTILTYATVVFGSRHAGIIVRYIETLRRML